MSLESSNNTVDLESESNNSRRFLSDLPNTNSRSASTSPSKSQHSSRVTSFADTITPAAANLDKSGHEIQSDGQSESGEEPEEESEEELQDTNPVTKYNLAEGDSWENLETDSEEELDAEYTPTRAGVDLEKENEEAKDLSAEDAVVEVDWASELAKRDASKDLEFPSVFAAEAPIDDSERTVQCVFDVATQTFTYTKNALPARAANYDHLESTPVIGGGTTYPYFDYTKDTLSIEYDICGEEGSNDQAMLRIINDLRASVEATTKLRDVEFKFCFRTASAVAIADALSERNAKGERIFKALETVLLTNHDHKPCWEFDDEAIIYNQADALGVCIWGTNDYPFKTGVGWLQKFS